MCVAFLLTFLALAVNGQPQQVDSKQPVFDVAVIKPTDLSAPRNGCFIRGQPGGQTFIGRCVPVRLIIKRAYRIIDSQITGGPAWLDSELYDFDAKADRAITRAEVEVLFQGLLADRFKLKFHKETRALAALVLTVDKGGQKMTPNDSTYEWEIPVQGIPGPIPKVKGIRCPLSYLSWWIAQVQNRPVVDKTGLSGFWDFTLEFVPDRMESRRGPNGESIPLPEGPTIYTALREQLGLKLQPEKGPVEVYVIDHAEKPEAN
jgi:uncharacterized protein (TIGR03435 family)